MSKKQKHHFRLRKLTIFMILVMIVTTVIDSVCIYDIFGKNEMPTVHKSQMTQEEKAAEEEREAYEQEKQEREKSGKVLYTPTEEAETQDMVIRDEDDAFDILLEVQDEFGIVDAEQEYKFSFVNTNDDYDIYTMQQYCDGLEVYGYNLKITADKSGALLAITGAHASLGDLNTEITLSESEARDYLEKYMKSQHQCAPDDLNVFSMGKKIAILDHTEPVVGYMYEVAFRSLDIVQVQIFVDGNTGEVLSDNELVDSEMITLDSDDPESPNRKAQGQQVAQTLDVWRQSDENYQMRDTERNITVYEANKATMSGEADYDLIQWNPQEENPNASGVDALANLQRINNYYFDTFGRVGVENNDNAQLSVIVGVTNIQTQSGVQSWEDNAAMSGTNMMIIGTRSNASEVEYSADLNVIGHEYTHGVINSESDLGRGNYTYDRQTSTQLAIHEGLADIFAELAEDYLDDSQYNNSCDWRLADGVRDITDPSNSQESGTHLTEAKKFVPGSTNCHNGSTIISYPVYLMTQEIDGDSSKKIDNTELLGKMWYAIIPQLSSTTDFQDVRRLIEINTMLKNRAYHEGNTEDSEVITDSQIECVLDAFDRVGIENSYDYSLTEDATLKVYDCNNKLYDNYHISVRRMFGDEILSQDIKEKSYKLKLDPGLYRVVLTDLDNKELTESFTLIVNDNDSKDKVDNYKKTGKIYTNFCSTERQIALVLDVSGSMDGTPMSETKKAASKFINTVLEENPNTKISIVTYSDTASTVLESCNKKYQLRFAISRLNSSGATNMYDALSTAHTILEEKNTDKKMMIVMSDGLPCAGESVNDDYSEPVITLADSIKKQGITIYSLGFFHNLSGDELTAGTRLMENIASSGYHFNVQSVDEIEFVFNDIAQQVNGKTCVLIRIACPVEVSVTYNGQTLSSDPEMRNIRTDFGCIAFEGEDEEVKVLRLFEDVDYEVCINGTGEGTMDYSISFADEEGTYSDERRFSDIPITKKTMIATNTNSVQKTVMNVDSDGDGIFDLKYVAKESENGELVEIRWWLYGAVGAGSLFVLLVIFKLLEIKKRYKSNKYCPQCGCKNASKMKFCSKCGCELHKVPLFFAEKETQKKQHKAVWITKLIVIGLCLICTTGIVSIYKSAATTVYKQIRNQEYISARIIYEDHVEDSKMAREYLSLMIEHYLDQIQVAHKDGKVDEEAAVMVYQAITDMDMGKVSDKAEIYLK